MNAMVWARVRLFAATALIASTLAACATPQGKSLAFRETEATAFTEDRSPLFRASSEYLSNIVAASTEVLTEQDGFVPVAYGGETFWLSCAQLIASVCTEEAVASAQAATLIEPRGGGVPYCPGDPRCPKPKSK